MTKNAKRTNTASQASAFPNLDPTPMMRSFLKRVCDASASASNPVTGWLEMRQHWITFLTERLKQDTALLQEFTECDNPADMMVAYTDFLKEAVDDYQREFAEISKLGQKKMAHGIASNESEAAPLDAGKTESGKAYAHSAQSTTHRRTAAAQK